MSDHDDLRPARGFLASAFIGLLLYAAGISLVAMWIWWMP